MPASRATPRWVEKRIGAVRVPQEARFTPPLDPNLSALMSRAYQAS